MKKKRWCNIFERKEFTLKHLSIKILERNRFYDLVYRFNENNFLSEEKLFFFEKVNKVLNKLKPSYFGILYFNEEKGLSLKDSCLLFGVSFQNFNYQKKTAKTLDKEAYLFVKKLFFNFFSVEYISFIKKL